MNYILRATDDDHNFKRRMELAQYAGTLQGYIESAVQSLDNGNVQWAKRALELAMKTISDFK
jgi:hypothetical protein